MRRAAAAAAAAAAVGVEASSRRKSSSSSSRVSKDARLSAQRAAESLLALEAAHPSLASAFEACLLRAEEEADKAAVGAGVGAAQAANRAASMFVHELARRRVEATALAMAAGRVEKVVSVGGVGGRRKEGGEGGGDENTSHLPLHSMLGYSACTR